MVGLEVGPEIVLRRVVGEEVAAIDGERDAAAAQKVARRPAVRGHQHGGVPAHQMLRVPRVHARLIAESPERRTGRPITRRTVVRIHPSLDVRARGSDEEWLRQHGRKLSSGIQGHRVKARARPGGAKRQRVIRDAQPAHVPLPQRRHGGAKPRLAASIQFVTRDGCQRLWAEAVGVMQRRRSVIQFRAKRAGLQDQGAEREWRRVGDREFACAVEIINVAAAGEEGVELVLRQPGRGGGPGFVRRIAGRSDGGGEGFPVTSLRVGRGAK